MMLVTGQEIPVKQQERLAFIEFLLRFRGSASRADLCDKFGIQPSAATKDFRAYKEQAETNLYLDQKTKYYLINEKEFHPIFPIGVQSALLKLREPATAKSFGFTQMDGIVCPPRLSLPNLEVLSAITRAIATHRAVKISYLSPSNGESSRIVAPHALVDNGLRWHVRAFDRKRNKFSDFVLTRCISAEVLKEEISETESKVSDHQWNRVVELEIKPHPNKDNVYSPEAIAHDFGMTDGSLKLHVRASVAGYWLRLWNVDCSKSHCLKGKEYQLWLSNTETLYGVENLFLAPGYSDKE